jgi:hypothetical protein
MQALFKDGLHLKQKEKIIILSGTKFGGSLHTCSAKTLMR